MSMREMPDPEVILRVERKIVTIGFLPHDLQGLAASFERLIDAWETGAFDQPDSTPHEN